MASIETLVHQIGDARLKAQIAREVVELVAQPAVGRADDPNRNDCDRPWPSLGPTRRLLPWRLSGGGSGP